MSVGFDYSQPVSSAQLALIMKKSCMIGYRDSENLLSSPWCFPANEKRMKVAASMMADFAAPPNVSVHPKAFKANKSQPTRNSQER